MVERVALAIGRGEPCEAAPGGLWEEGSPQCPCCPYPTNYSSWEDAHMRRLHPSEDSTLSCAQRTHLRLHQQRLQAGVTPAARAPRTQRLGAAPSMQPAPAMPGAAPAGMAGTCVAPTSAPSAPLRQRPRRLTPVADMPPAATKRPRLTTTPRALPGASLPGALPAAAADAAPCSASSACTPTTPADARPPLTAASAASCHETPRPKRRREPSKATAASTAALAIPTSSWIRTIPAIHTDVALAQSATGMPGSQTSHTPLPKHGRGRGADTDTSTLQLQMQMQHPRRGEG